MNFDHKFKGRKLAREETFQADINTRVNIRRREQVSVGDRAQDGDGMIGQTEQNWAGV